jgi:hypothetical protein
VEIVLVVEGATVLVAEGTIILAVVAVVTFSMMIKAILLSGPALI